MVVHAKTSDSQMIISSLKQEKELDVQLQYLVVDMDYIDVKQLSIDQLNHLPL